MFDAQKVMASIAAKSLDRQRRRDDDYEDDDGLLICGRCHHHRQEHREFPAGSTEERAVNHPLLQKSGHPTF